jgi:hypothetical protein
MGCECIPPPPIFDLPPPPDPTLIWHLISDEPESALRKVRLQTCEFNPIYEFIGLEGTLKGLILFGVSCFLTVLFTVCTVTICYQKLCRRKCPKRSPSSSGDTSSKFNSSSDTIVTNGVTPITQWNPRSPQFVTIGMPQYGSASVNNIASNNTLLIRSQPVMGLQSSTTMMRIPKPQQPRSFAVRQPIDQTSAYCTLNRHYEEIPVNYAMPPSNSGTSTIPTSFSHNFNRGPSQRRFIEQQQQQPTQAMLFLDRLAAAQNNIERKPPPTCRPPPPPSDSSTNRSSASTDELDGSSMDAEIEVINRQQHCSPINSRQSEFGGRESGYGTGPSRLWNHQSPRAPPKTILKDSSSPPSTTSTNASPPSLKTALCGNSNNNDSQKPMTYV